MFPQILMFIVGLLLLVFGAEYFIAGSSLIAKRFGIPKLIIGLTIVALGTSSPELVFNVISSAKGYNGLSLGNVLGSNVANILLIFGVGALFAKRIRINRGSLKQLSLMTLVSLLIMGFGYTAFYLGEGSLATFDGLLFLAAGLFYWMYLYRLTKEDKERLEVEDLSHNRLSKVESSGILSLVVLLSLGALLGGAQIMTDSAVFIATTLGVPQIFIAATIIAIGTSLPELVTAIQAIRQKQYDLMIGTVVGSNIVNTLLVLGLSALINPLPVSSQAILYLRANFIVSVLFLVAVLFPRRQVFERWKGIAFIILYIFFLLLAIVWI